MLKIRKITNNVKKSLAFPANLFNIRLVLRRGGRAAECTGLENQRGLIALRRFKSDLLRHIRKGLTIYSEPFLLSSSPDFK